MAEMPTTGTGEDQWLVGRPYFPGFIGRREPTASFDRQHLSMGLDRAAVFAGSRPLTNAGQREGAT